MLKSSKSNLAKTEELFKEIGYVIRYEKGHFQSGYCIVEDKKIVVINKFYDTAGRVDVLLDILSGTLVMKDSLSDKSRAWYEKILKTAF